MVLSRSANFDAACGTARLHIADSLLHKATFEADSRRQRHGLSSESWLRENLLTAQTFGDRKTALNLLPRFFVAITVIPYSCTVLMENLKMKF